MTEPRRRRPPAEPQNAAADVLVREAREGSEAREGEDAERLLGRVVAVGLPIAAVVSAIVVGFIASVGSGLLVLASGALLGAIALFWASVRTLTGDAPLPVDLEAIAAQSRDVDALGEQKRRVLRALKDIESEHAIGKIDDGDYEAIARQYRDEAKALMRAMDETAAPAIAEAEKIALAYLAAQGLGGESNKSNERHEGKREGGDATRTGAGAHASGRDRVACPNCTTSNESDAAFCKKCGTALATETSATESETDATT